MAVTNRSWYERNRPHLEFYFDLWPVIRIATQLVNESYERNVFTYCRLELWLFKHRLFSFNLYKPHTYMQEPPRRLSQRLTRAVRRLWPVKNARRNSGLTRGEQS